MARPNCCDLVVDVAPDAPPPTNARCAAGSTRTFLIGPRSITMPPSTSSSPATLWPPPRTATVSSLARREAERRDHVGRAGAAGDHGGLGRVVCAVPEALRLVVTFVSRLEQLATERIPQLLDRWPHRGPVQASNSLLPPVRGLGGTVLTRPRCRPFAPLCEAAKAVAHVLDTLCVASGGERLERLLEQFALAASSA